MIQAPLIAATGGALVSCRKVMRRPSGSSVRREVQFFASSPAVAQIRMRSSSPLRSTWSTWMVGGKIRGQFATSASSR